MTRRAGRERPVVTVRYLEDTTLVTGPVRVLHSAVRSTCPQWRYDSLYHGYVVPTSCISDVIELVETIATVVVSRAGGTR